jgi:hypothetical protein
MEPAASGSGCRRGYSHGVLDYFFAAFFAATFLAGAFAATFFATTFFTAAFAATAFFATTFFVAAFLTGISALLENGLLLMKPFHQLKVYDVKIVLST